MAANAKAHRVAKTRSIAKPFKTKIATRKDIQYLIAFLAGTLTPFVGGAFAAVISSSFWSQLAAHGRGYDPSAASFVDAVTYAVIALVFMAGMTALILAFHRFGTRVSFRGVFFSILLVGAVAFFTIMLSYEMYALWPNPDPNLDTYLDLLTVIVFGFAYVLGWWVARHYAKLVK